MHRLGCGDGARQDGTRSQEHICVSYRFGLYNFTGGIAYIGFPMAVIRFRANILRGVLKVVLRLPSD